MYDVHQKPITFRPEAHDVLSRNGAKFRSLLSRRFCMRDAPTATLLTGLALLSATATARGAVANSTD